MSKELTVTTVIKIPDNDCLGCCLQSLNWGTGERICKQFDKPLKFKKGKFLQCSECLAEAK